jgi:ABC-type phosphate transport system substrate-binding protein
MEMNFQKQKTGLFVGLIIGVLLGAGGLIFISPPAGNYVTGTITTAGSTTVYPLSQDWATRFHEQVPGLVVNPGTGGSGFGQSMIAQGLIDIGASSAYPKEEYIVENPSVEILPVSADAIGIVVNEGVNGSIFNMDCDMVVAVFQRNVTTWQEFSTTFDVSVSATGPISVFVRSDASGTTATFAKWLETANETNNANNENYQWTLGHEESISFPAGISSVDGNQGVSVGVQSNNLGIGYVGLAFMENLTKVNLYNPGNDQWIAPSISNAVLAMPDNITSPGQDLMNSVISGAYPVARLLFYLVNRDYLRWEPITYITWCMIQGQKYVEKVGYVPINGTSAQDYTLRILGELEPSTS